MKWIFIYLTFLCFFLLVMPITGQDSGQSREWGENEESQTRKRPQAGFIFARVPSSITRLLQIKAAFQTEAWSLGGEKCLSMRCRNHYRPQAQA